MNRGRPPKPDTKYHVIVHTTNGLRYAATKIFKEGKSGKRNHCYLHWGRLLEGNRFHPGPAYFYADPAERRKLRFPEGWDLGEVESLEGNRPRGRVAYEAGDVDRQYGVTWLLDRVAERTGLAADLKKVFGGNAQMVDDVLTLAYFPFVDGMSYNRLRNWQREVKAPSDRALTGKAITALTQGITERNRMDLFRRRAARVGRDELCAVDSTSVSSYGFNLADIRWGKNKERLPLRQTLEVVVYSLTSHQPIYYKELPGNMPDCRTVETILKDLRDAGFRDLVLVTDRGYDSMRNFEEFIARGQKIITSVKVTGGEVLERIRAVDMSAGYPANMTLAEDEDVYYAQYDTPYSVKGNGDNVIAAVLPKLNLYFDPRRRVDETCAVQRAVQEQKNAARELVASGKPVEDRKDTVERLRFLNLAFDGSGVLTGWTVDDGKVRRRMLASGFYASRTLGLDCGAMEARGNYALRDEQEKVFALQKGPLGKDRLRAWSEAGRHGRMFICFIALILASYVRSVYSQSKWLRDNFDSIWDVLDEMRTIRCIEHDGRAKFITPFVGNQIKICEIFGFEIPEKCSKDYTSKRVNPPKRGRKPKAKVEHQEI